jgi:hypothetical protein
MTQRKTEILEQKPSHNLSQSVAAGVKSLVGGSGRTFYVLKHLSATKAYPLGTEQEIIIDYIELGRDRECQVRFENSLETVSRQHAAITRGPNGWVLRNLSQTNPTLINGRQVNMQWFLANGDEIQLSMEGPKIRFILPANNSVNAIPLAQRFTLFRQQAMRPYRNAIIALSTVLVMSVATSAWFGLHMTQKNDELEQKSTELARQSETLKTNLQAAIAKGEKIDKDFKLQLDSTKKADANLKASMAKEVRNLKRLLRETQHQSTYAQPNATPAYNSSITPANSDMATLDATHPSIYFLKIESFKVTIDEKTDTYEDFNITGTGFLLTDGRFVTARHMVQPWAFLNQAEPDAAMILLNMVKNSGGNVVATLKAYSPDGSTFTFTSSDFTTDESADVNMSIVDPASGSNVTVKIASFDDGKDWATYRTGRSGRITSAPSLCKVLPASAKIYTLGYPFALGVTSANDIKPQYGHSEVASSGLSNGMIRVTDRNFDLGSSGSPAFYSDGGRIVVVGIVSTGQGNQGGLVPISQIR